MLNISELYSRTPGARYERESKFSGENFRVKFLLPAIKDALNNNTNVTVDLDGTKGYGTSFLEEVFGGLVRLHNITESDLKKHLNLKSDKEPYLIEDIWDYISKAELLGRHALAHQ